MADESVATATAEPAPIMTLGEVASLFKVGDQTVRDWTDKGLLPHFRTPGGQRRFRREDVERFIKDQEPAA